MNAPPMLLMCLTLAGAQDAERVAPRDVEWKALAGMGFQDEWVLPAQTTDTALELACGLAALRFEEGPEELRSLGDLWEASAVMNSKQVTALVQRFCAEHREAGRTYGAVLQDLLDRRGLFGRRWDPDEAEAPDGIAELASLDLDTLGSAPWGDLDGNSDLHQALVLVRGDEQDWLAATHRYDRYPGHVNAKYQAIHAIRERYVVGAQGPRGPFAAVELALRNDLPFPFGDYEGHIWVLHRLDAAGRLVVDVHSSSRCFRWLAGQDVLLPIERADGTRIGSLALRRYGFELRGVPEKAKHRRAALRASLGNLVRDTETLRRQRGGALRPLDGVLPRFAVVGAGPALVR